MVKAIIFDVGGVLVDLDVTRSIDKFRALGFSDVSDFIDPCIQRGFFMKLEEGALSRDEFINLCLGHCAPGTTVQQVTDAFSALILEVDSAKVDCLNNLKSRGYKLYLLSNNNPLNMPLCLQRIKDKGCDPSLTFEKQFVSYQMKLVKPSAAMFDAVAQSIGLDRKEMLFVDDSLKNVQASEACGIPAVHYVQGTDLAATLEPRLV